MNAGTQRTLGSVSCIFHVTIRTLRGRGAGCVGFGTLDSGIMEDCEVACRVGKSIAFFVDMAEGSRE